MPWLAATTLSPHQEDSNDTLQRFVLETLHRLIIAEEHITNRPSTMRIFVRMDISVFRNEGCFQYYINELTRSHQTGLFCHWDVAGRMDLCIQDLAKVLHYVTYQRLWNRRFPLQ
jgi:hypothetical protein